MNCVADTASVRVRRPIVPPDVELLTGCWSSLLVHEKAQAIQVAQAAARAWALNLENRLTRERAVVSGDFTIYLVLHFGWDTAHRLGSHPDWDEDESDFRVFHFCTELEKERRRIFGLPPAATDAHELRAALTEAEGRFWEASAAHSRAWAAIRDDYDRDLPGFRESEAYQAYEATKEPVNAALSDALLARMMLNAATGAVADSDVWECRRATDCEEDEEMEVHLVSHDTMRDAAEDFRCEPRGAGNRAEMSLAAR